MKTASFFAGVGGIDLAFDKAGFTTVWANEIDSNAAQTYKLNFESELIIKDIKNVDAYDIPDFDIMLAGFPCQAFSVAGHRKGFEDERGNLFFELVRIIKIKKPSVVFLENVKNLVGHDQGNTFRTILRQLKNEGYHVKKEVLNASEYGNLPQNRERIYIVAFSSEKACKEFNFPEPIELKHTLADYIDYENLQEDKYYYTPESCDFYLQLKESMNNPQSIYQWRRIYVRENKSNVCPTLTANMGTGGHNVPLISTKHGIRKLTPRECFNIMGYGKDFLLPQNLANTHLYKQAGNSVVIPVVERIASNIMTALEATSIEKKQLLTA
ncbi:MAG: DNA cytosine methyltransferase [Thiohalomonadaceae bacterium]